MAVGRWTAVSDREPSLNWCRLDGDPKQEELASDRWGGEKLFRQGEKSVQKHKGTEASGVKEMNLFLSHTVNQVLKV